MLAVLTTQHGNNSTPVQGLYVCAMTLELDTPTPSVNHTPYLLHGSEHLLYVCLLLSHLLLLCHQLLFLSHQLLLLLLLNNLLELHLHGNNSTTTQSVSVSV